MDYSRIQILLKYTEYLLGNLLNRKKLRKEPNIQSLDIVLPTIEVFVSDDNTQRIAKGRRKNVFYTREEEEENNKGKHCFLCDERHKFQLAECKYKSCFCGKHANHKRNKCFLKYPWKKNKGVKTEEEEEEELNQ